VQQQPRRRRVRAAQPGVGLLLVLALLAGCERDVAVGAIGASIVALDARRLAVVDRDQGSVSLVDGDSLEPLARIDVGEDPRALLVAAERLWVLVRRGGELVELARDDGRVLRRQSVCAGPTALAETPQGSLLVACEWDGRVVSVDPSSLAVRDVAELMMRPVAVAAAGDAVLVLEGQGSLVRVADGSEARVSLVPTADSTRPALTRMQAHHPSAMALSEDGRTVAVSFELVNPSGEGNGEPVVDDYGSVADGRPKINPALRLFSTSDLSEREAPSTYARYDGDLAARCNGPSAVVMLDEGHAIVAHRSSSDLAVVRLGGSADDRLSTVHAVGDGPAGVAIDRRRGIAWSDDALGGTISRVELATGVVTRRVRDLPPGASSMAVQGRRSFFDSTNPHLSPAGVVACATCHPDGGDDGTVWFIRSPTIPAKRRVTPHLANAGAATAPYHWDGGLADRTTLVYSTITNLMAGDALLVDGDAIAAYLDELVKAPVPPAGDAMAIARGSALFDANCAGCHAPPLYTDRQRHAIAAAPSEGPDALPMADTPALRGLFLRARFLHDGRASSLEDLLSRDDLVGHGAALGGQDRINLASFLRSL
jgi:DNA-binding beta-propeller fold protein YncE